MPASEAKDSFLSARVSNVRPPETPGEATAAPEGLLESVPDEIRRQLSDDVVDGLLAGAKTEKKIVGPGGLLSQLTRRLLERALEVELTDHLGYEPHREPPGGARNTRNGKSAKTLVADHGPVEVDTPGIGLRALSPKLVRKRQRRLRALTRRSWRSTHGCRVPSLIALSSPTSNIASQGPKERAEVSNGVGNPGATSRGIFRRKRLTATASTKHADQHPRCGP
jgi:hypothetical protein